MNLSTPSTFRRVQLNLFCGLFLFLAFSLQSFSQAKPAITVNPGSLVINASTFTAKTMLAPGMLKALGKPDRVDTLVAAEMQSLSAFTMATLNKYSNGLLLMQGRKTERINGINIYLNPVASKKYIDYINTPYSGKLTLLGMKIDSNTTIRQVEKVLARYKPELSEEYLSLDLDVFDPKNGGRLMEIRFTYLKGSEKIEYINFEFFPAPALKKQVIEYKGGQVFLNGLLLDTAAGKIHQFKKILGEPNAIFEVSYRGQNGQSYKARRFHYDDISGITLIENPFNQGILALQMDFLSIRGEKTLGNPVFDLVVNGKKFDPENAVPNGTDYMKAHYAFDSVSTKVDEKDNKAYVTSSNNYGSLEFVFASKYAWGKRVYYVNYHLLTARRPTETVSEPLSVPSLEVKQGMMILKTNKNSAYWTGSVNSVEAFKEVMGNPTTTTSGGVSEFPSFGVRMWTKGSKLDVIQFYLQNYINAYSGRNDAPGIYAGTIEVEGAKLTRQSTLEQVMAALSVYNLQKAYDDKNHTVYKGSYKGIITYLIFGITDKKLISVSFNR